MELDLLNALGGGGVGGAVGEDLGGAGVDAVVGGVDVISEEFVGLVVFCCDAVALH
jgi:hypothetical protein